MTAMTGVQGSRGAVIWLGVLIGLAGLVLLLWPAATTFVLVSWLGLAVIVYGVFELINAFSGAGDRSRLWAGVIGVIAIIGGAAIFLTPVISSITVGLVIGWYWIIGGIFGIVAAFVESGNRLVRGLIAALSVLAGIIVIAQPGIALVTLVWLSGAWMLAAGVIMVVGAVFGRRQTVAAV